MADVSGAFSSDDKVHQSCLNRIMKEVQLLEWNAVAYIEC